jgi:hypothetical protein
MPKVGDRHFAYTPEGMAAAERYKQNIGMNAGVGMLGFRPLGYADGDLVEKYAYQDAAARQAAIDFILSTTGSTSDSMVATLLSMSDPELRRAELKVIGDAEAGKYDSVPRKDIRYIYPDILNTPLDELFPTVPKRSIEPSMQSKQPKQLMQPMQQPQPSMPPMQEFNKRDIIPEFLGPNTSPLPGGTRSAPQELQKRHGRDLEMPPFEMPNLLPLNPRMLEQLRRLEKPTPRPGIEPEGGYWIKDGGYVGRGMKNGGIMSLRRY